MLVRESKKSESEKYFCYKKEKKNENREMRERVRKKYRKIGLDFEGSNIPKSVSERRQRRQMRGRERERERQRKH